MEKKRSVGVTLYGLWGILVGLFYISSPWFIPRIIEVSFSVDKAIRGSLWGSIYILISILLMTKFKLGKMKQNHKRLFFLYMNIVTAFLWFQAALHFTWTHTIIGDLLPYIIILTFIIIPITSIIYFNIPSLKSYFKEDE